MPAMIADHSVIEMTSIRYEWKYRNGRRAAKLIYVSVDEWSDAHSRAMIISRFSAMIPPNARLVNWHEGK